MPPERYREPVPTSSIVEDLPTRDPCQFEVGPGRRSVRNATIGEPMGWLSDLLRGGGDELGWDDLVRRIVDAIAGLRQYGPRGEVAFPDAIVVRITVPEGATSVVQGFIDRPELDREV